MEGRKIKWWGAQGAGEKVCIIFWRKKIEFFGTFFSNEKIGGLKKERKWCWWWWWRGNENIKMMNWRIKHSCHLEHDYRGDGLNLRWKLMWVCTWYVFMYECFCDVMITQLNNQTKPATNQPHTPELIFILRDTQGEKRDKSYIHARWMMEWE